MTERQAEQAGRAQQRGLPVCRIRERLLLELQLIGHAVDRGLVRPAAHRETAVGRCRKGQDDQVLQLDGQSHRRRGVDPLPQFRHGDGAATVPRMALREARLPVRLDQQMRLTHLPQLAGVDHRAHQLAGGGVLHQPALARRLDGLLDFRPHLLDDAGLDLGIELRVGRVLMGKQLPQQALESRLEFRPHRWPRRQRRVQRLELLVRRQRVAHRISRLGADAVGHFQLRPQLDAQLVELVARQGLGLHPVDEREVGRVVVKALTLQDVVQHHQPPQVGQRLVAQERGQPHQRLGVAAAVLRQAGQIVGGAEVRVVKRKVQHHRPGARAAAQPVVGHLAHVLVQQLHLAPGSAPIEFVGGEQATGVRNLKFLEQRLPDPLAPIAGVVVRLGSSQDRLDVHARHLDRDDRVLVFGDLDLADLAGPVAALAQHVLRLAARDG